MHEDEDDEKIKSMKEWKLLSSDLRDYLTVMLQDPVVRRLILEQDMDPSTFLAGGWKTIERLRSRKS